MAKAEIKIGGMTCAMCAGAIEKALRQLPGVESATVNLGSEQAYVDYDRAETGLEPMRKAIEALGYRYLGVEEDAGEKEKKLLDREMRTRRRRIAVGFASGLPLMAVMFLPASFFFLLAPGHAHFFPARDCFSRFPDLSRRRQGVAATKT